MCNPALYVFYFVHEFHLHVLSPLNLILLGWLLDVMLALYGFHAVRGSRFQPFLQIATDVTETWSNLKHGTCKAVKNVSSDRLEGSKLCVHGWSAGSRLFFSLSTFPSIVFSILYNLQTTTSLDKTVILVNDNILSQASSWKFLTAHHSLLTTAASCFFLARSITFTPLYCTFSRHPWKFLLEFALWVPSDKTPPKLIL